MPSTSTYSPTFEREFHSPREAGHPVHYWPTSRLYNVENCVNCGYQYEFKKSKYDSNGDATTPWKHLSAIVAEHYYSCPKKFANIHQPTSAIRGTLPNPSGQKRQRGVERMRSPPFYTPYPRNPSRRMGADSPPFHDSRPASPEPSPAVAPHNSPQRIESSTLAARPQRNKPFPGSAAHRAPDVPQRSPDYRSVTRPSQPPVRSWRRGSPPPPLKVVTNDESITVPPSPPIVLPPLWNRKRKRAQFQESGDTDPHPPRNHLTGAEPSSVGAGSNVLPQSPSPSPLGRPSAENVITAAPGQDPPEPYIDYADSEEQRPAKKAKKNVMSWEERRDTMERDPLLSIVEAKRVYCKPCRKWIKLDARNDFYPGLWVKHRKTMHGVLGFGAGYSAPERRRRSGSGVGGGSGVGSIGGACSKRRRTACNPSRRQDQVQESYRRNVTAATRRVRSSSRITRSSSGASV